MLAAPAKSSRSIFAGILMLFAVVITLSELLCFEEAISPRPMAATLRTLLYIIGIAATIAGGIFTLIRRPWGLSIKLLISSCFIFNTLWLILCCLSEHFYGINLGVFESVLGLVSIVLSPIPYFIQFIVSHPPGNGANVLFFYILMPGIISAIVGGVCGVKRRLWGLSLAGYIGAFLISPIVSTASLVLTPMSRKEFRHI